MEGLRQKGWTIFTVSCSACYVDSRHFTCRIGVDIFCSLNALVACFEMNAFSKHISLNFIIRELLKRLEDLRSALSVERDERLSERVQMIRSMARLRAQLR